MKLWLLERTDDVGWDEYLGFVVRVDDGLTARAMAHVKSSEPQWVDPDLATCECIGEGPGDPAIVLESFKAG